MIPLLFLHPNMTMINTKVTGKYKKSLDFSRDSHKLLTGIGPVTSALPMRRSTD